MSGKGRGGGRGTGRGILMEQLGMQRGDLPTKRLDVPPETFPPLQFRPVSLPEENNVSESYMLVVKKELRDYLQNSEYCIQLDAVKTDVERYSDRLNIIMNKKNNLSLCWSRFPSELNPQSRKKVKRKVAPNIPLPPSKKIKDVNVIEKLTELEKKESHLQEGDEDEDVDDDETEIVDEAEDVDEEMDEGTDYINSYFDNGEEDNLDDDDALEEGGVF